MAGARMMRRSSPCATCGGPGPLMRFGDGRLYCLACRPQHLFDEQDSADEQSRRDASISWPKRPKYGRQDTTTLTY